MAGISRTPYLMSASIADTSAHALYSPTATTAIFGPSATTYVALANQPVSPAAPKGLKAFHLKIFNDLTNGAAIIYIGNENVSATPSTTNGYGVSLVAGQVFEAIGYDSNLLDLSQIYLVCSASAVITFQITTR